MKANFGFTEFLMDTWSAYRRNVLSNEFKNSDSLINTGGIRDYTAKQYLTFSEQGKRLLMSGGLFVAGIYCFVLYICLGELYKIFANIDSGVLLLLPFYLTVAILVIYSLPVTISAVIWMWRNKRRELKK